MSKCVELQSAHGCSAKQMTSESPSLADDVRFHRSSPRDVISSTCQRQQPGQRGCRSGRGSSIKNASVSRFVCPSCLAGFVNRATLVRHARVHTGHRPYRCPVCSRAFTQSGNLTRHMRAKHAPAVVIGNQDTRPSS